MTKSQKTPRIKLWSSSFVTWNNIWNEITPYLNLKKLSTTLCERYTYRIFYYTKKKTFFLFLFQILTYETRIRTCLLTKKVRSQTPICLMNSTNSISRFWSNLVAGSLLPGEWSMISITIRMPQSNWYYIILLKLDYVRNLRILVLE